MRRARAGLEHARPHVCNLHKAEGGVCAYTEAQFNRDRHLNRDSIYLLNLANELLSCGWMMYGVVHASSRLLPVRRAEVHAVRTVVDLPPAMQV